MSSTSKQAIVSLFQDLARQIQNLDDDDIANVFNGKSNLQIHLQDIKQNTKEKKDKLSKDTLETIANTLKTFTTREEGELLLKEKISSKNDLTELAKYLDLRVKKNDTTDQIRTKLIESTIGFRLRSAAIQGTLVR